MEEVIKELIDYYKEKNCNVTFKELKNNVYKIIMKVKINKKEFEETADIKKDFISETHKEFIKNGINYNLHNAYDKYLRGE